MNEEISIKKIEQLMEYDEYDSIQILPNGEIEAYKSSEGIKLNATPKIFTLREVLADNH